MRADLSLAATDREVVERAQATAERIAEGCRAIRSAWVHLGGYLHEFVEDRMWEPLGCDSLEEWLASPEIGLGRSQVFRLVRVYRELVVARLVPPGELEGVDVTKVDVVLAAVKAGRVDFEDALADCKTLTRRDLQVKYGSADPKGGGEEPARFQCPECGSWVAA